MVQQRSATAACTLIMVLLCVGCSNGPYFDGQVEAVIPTFVVGIPSAENLNELDRGSMVVISSDLSECILGHGVARALSHENSEEWWAAEFEVPCREVTIPTADILRGILDGKGYVSGRGPIPLNRKPLKASGDHWGYHRLIQGKHVEYYILYNDSHIRLIRWTSGNRWGTETDHTYSVLRSAESVVIETTRSETRQAALEWFPEQ